MVVVTNSACREPTGGYGIPLVPQSTFWNPCWKLVKTGEQTSDRQNPM